MTPKQAAQFNLMRETLIKISRGYQTIDQLKRSCEREYGLNYVECLEMVYENLQHEAKWAIKGIKGIKIGAMRDE